MIRISLLDPNRTGKDATDLEIASDARSLSRMEPSNRSLTLKFGLTALPKRLIAFGIPICAAGIVFVSNIATLPEGTSPTKGQQSPSVGAWASNTPQRVGCSVVAICLIGLVF